MSPPVDARSEAALPSMTIPVRAAERAGAPRRGVVRWLSLGSFSVLDQALFAGTSFVVTILLARWLSPGGFGAFALAFSLLMLLVPLHSAVLTEPMGVFGAGKYAGGFRRYARFLLSSHFVVTGATALVVAGAAGVLALAGATEVAAAIAALAAATPFALLLWLARRAFYVRFVPQWAALGGLVYLALLVPSIALLHRTGRLSGASAFLAVGACSLVVSLGLIGLLRRRVPRETGDFDRTWDARAAVRDHARYGRWALAAAVTLWVGSNVQYFVLGAAGSVRQVAAMRTLDTLILPYWQYLAALSSLLLPALSAHVHRGGRDLRPFAARTAALFLLQGTALTIVLVFAGGSLMRLVYGDTYSRYGHYVPILALTLIPDTLTALALTFCRARVRTDLVFAYQGAYSLALVVALVAAVHWGIGGVVVARVIVSYGALALFVWVARAGVADLRRGMRRAFV